MTQIGPGKSYRKGITLIDTVRKFDSEEKAEALVHRSTVAGRRSMPILRFRQHRSAC